MLKEAGFPSLPQRQWGQIFLDHSLFTNILMIDFTLGISPECESKYLHKYIFNINSSPFMNADLKMVLIVVHH